MCWPMAREVGHRHNLSSSTRWPTLSELRALAPESRVVLLSIWRCDTPRLGVRTAAANECFPPLHPVGVAP